MACSRILSLVFRSAWYVAAVFVLLAAATLAGVVRAGSLDPPGGPASTMRPLDTIAPSWLRALASDNGVDPCSSSRFSCVMGGAAVLDRETGLVWEKTPGSSNLTWPNADARCETLSAGSRLGWRLPTVEELLTLADSDGMGLPAGHPFIGVAAAVVGDRYWSVTHFQGVISAGRTVTFFSAADVRFPALGENNTRAWCVRGGQGYDGI